MGALGDCVAMADEWVGCVRSMSQVGGPFSRIYA